MTQHEDKVRLLHMLENTRKAHTSIAGKQRTDLDQDHLLELALTRLLEIVGEAANRVSDDTKERYSQIPWGQIVSLRNRLIHGYDAVDLDILWNIIQYDLPPLIRDLEMIVTEM
ncbi:MAG: DUF86 domain-containing protein [Anaerolineales bacterium]|nr:DUF86 domain-containing protein [Anaerolineales bacterium]